MERSARDIKIFVRQKIDRLYEKLTEQNSNTNQQSAVSPPQNEDRKSEILALHNWNVLNEKIDSLHAKVDQMRHEEAAHTSEVITDLIRNIERFHQTIEERMEPNDAHDIPPPIIVGQGNDLTSGSPSISFPDEWKCSRSSLKNPNAARIREVCESIRPPTSDLESTECFEMQQNQAFVSNTNRKHESPSSFSTINTCSIPNPEVQSCDVQDTPRPQTPDPVMLDLVQTSLYSEEIKWCRGFFQKLINSKIIKLERMAHHMEVTHNISRAWIKGLDRSLILINDLESNGTMSVQEELKRILIKIFKQHPGGLLMIDLWRQITGNMSADAQSIQSVLPGVLQNIAKKVMIDNKYHYILNDKVQYVLMSKIRSLLIDIRERLESVLRGDCCEKKHSERIKNKVKELLKECKSASHRYQQRMKVFRQSPIRRHSPTMTDTTSDVADFQSWLINIVELPQYITNFKDHGFEDMLVISMITKEDLSAIGVDKIGHQRAILMHANRYHDVLNTNLESKQKTNLYKMSIKKIISCLIPQSPEHLLTHYHSKCDSLRELVESQHSDSDSDDSDSDSDDESDAEFTVSDSYWIEDPAQHEMYIESIMQFIKMNKCKKSKHDDQYVPIVDSSGYLYQARRLKISHVRQSKVMEVYEVEDHNRSTYLNRSTGLRSKMCIPEGTVIGEYITRYITETDLDTLQGTHLHQRVNEYAFSSQEIEVEMTLEQIQYYQNTKGLDDDEDMFLVEPPL